MKKLFLFPTLAMLAFASCSQDEITSIRQDGINYSVTTVMQTRAADSYCNNNLPAAFKVWAQTTDDGSLYINGDKIVNAGGNPTTWTDEAGVRYWPDGKTLDFYAQVNGDETFSFNNGEPRFVDFAINSDVAQQTDLMCAVSKGLGTSDGIVQLNFRHVLSQVCFKAKNTSSNLSVTIKGVSVGHLANQATYSFPTESTSDNYVNHTLEAVGTEPATKGTWSTPAENSYTALYSVAFDDITVAPQTTDAVNLTCPTDGDASTIANVMTLLPQTVSAWNPNAGQYDGAYFLIDAQLNNVADETLTPIYTGKIAIPVSVAWEQGKRYIYTFVFGEGGNGGWTDNPTNPQPVLTTINYNVTVDDFVPVNNDQNMQASIVYTLTYDSNGGADTDGKTTKQVTLNSEGTITIDETCPFTRTGYTFLGWAETKDATEATYTTGGSIALTKTEPTKTLYAVWQKEAAQPVTITLNTVADTWVRSNNTTDQSSATTMEIKTDDTNSSYMYGLMQFTIPSDVLDNTKYDITDAKLYLVSERNKGCGKISIYSIDTYGTKYADIETNITSSLATTPIIEAQAINGQSSKAVTDSGITSDYQVVSAWTNTFDFLTYVKSLTTSTFNLLLAASESNTTSFKIYTNDATDVTNTNVTPNFTFTADDLKPRLVITYVEK